MEKSRKLAAEIINIVLEGVEKDYPLLRELVMSPGKVEEGKSLLYGETYYEVEDSVAEKIGALCGEEITSVVNGTLDDVFKILSNRTLIENTY